jgi:hypothetical protein
LKTEQSAIDRAFKFSPRLAQWRQISLPASKDPRPEAVRDHLGMLQVEYERYLSDLLRRDGFAPSSISVTSKPVEPPRTGAGAAKGPPPLFRTLTFIVQGQAALDSLVKMLEEFHRASLLQQIRSFSVQRPLQEKAGAPRGALDVNLTVETLLVNGAEKHEGLMPASSATKPHVLAEPSRTYTALAAHNIFLGSTPVSTSAQSEDARDVLGFVKLTTVSNNNGRRWEAWLLDQGRKDGESRLRTSAGFNEFSFSDRFDNILVRGLVLGIDENGVLFRTNGRFCHIGLGESLFEALRASAGPPAAAGAVIGAAWAAPW